MKFYDDSYKPSSEGVKHALAAGNTCIILSTHVRKRKYPKRKGQKRKQLGSSYQLHITYQCDRKANIL